jgi:uncharacterized membrane protein
MKTADSFDNYVHPYAPCNKLSFSAPFMWLKKGWQDFRSAPWHSLVYGMIFAAMGWMLIYFSWTRENESLILALMVGFLLIGPALAFGLYDISQELELKHKPTFRHERRKALREMGHELMLVLLLGSVFLILAIVMSMVIDITVTPAQLAVSAAVPISTAVSLSIAVIFAGLFFCAMTFALPMIVDKDVNAPTAIMTSLHAVWLNKSVIALWALLILLLAVIGFATALIGLILIVPLIGYATWHAYRETIITKE